MGYETTLIFGEVWESTRKRNSVEVDVIAVVDMCKLGYNSATYELLAKSRKDHDGTKYKATLAGAKDYKMERVDLYDEPIAAVDLYQLLDTMKVDAKIDEYWRYDLAIALAEIFAESPRNITVLQYGH